MGIKLKIETWTSSENRKEVHVFIKGTQIYIFGYNPKYVSKKEVNKLLKKVKCTLPKIIVI